MTKTWLTLSGIQAKNCSTEAKESNYNYMFEKLTKAVNHEIKEACTKGRYTCSVSYDYDSDEYIVDNVIKTLVSNEYKVIKEQYNGGLGKRIVLNWEDVTND
jgi:hypothetical protein